MVTLSFYSKLVQDFEEEKNRVFGTKNVKGSVDNPILFITDHNPTFGEKKTLLTMLPLVKEYFETTFTYYIILHRKPRSLD